MNKKEKRRRILRESILTALTTLLLLGASLLVFAWFHHARPAKGQSAGIVVASPTPYAPESPGVPAPSPSEAEASALSTATPAPLDLMAAYGDRFSPQEQKSENGYTGAKLHFTLSRVQYGTGKDAMYYLADIYVGDVRCLKTMLAEDTYGRGIRESVKSMAQRGGGILAITGDTYGNQDAGIVIRNGVVHREEKSDFDVCVLYYDGVMETYSPQEFSLETAVSRWSACRVSRHGPL